MITVPIMIFDHHHYHHNLSSIIISHLPPSSSIIIYHLPPSSSIIIYRLTLSYLIAIQINSRAATQGIVRINQQSAMLSLSDYLHHKSINNDKNISSNISFNNNNNKRSSSAPPATRIHSNNNNTANAVRKSQISFADYTAVHDDSMSHQHQHLRSSNNKDAGITTSTTPLDTSNNTSSTPSTPYIAKLKSATNIARWASSSLADYFESRGNHHDMSMHDIKSNDRVGDGNIHSISTPTRRAATEMMTSTKKPISSLRSVTNYSMMIDGLIDRLITIMQYCNIKY